MGETVRGGTVQSFTITNDQPSIDGKMVSDQYAPGGGPSLAAGAVSINAAFGSTATRSVSGKTTRGKVSVSSAGTGQGTGATVTINFPAALYKTAPAVFIRQTAGTALGFKVNSVSATQLVIGVISAPVAANTYDVEYVILPT